MKLIFNALRILTLRLARSGRSPDAVDHLELRAWADLPAYHPFVGEDCRCAG